jgi:hypothetical protein
MPPNGPPPPIPDWAQDAPRPTSPPPPRRRAINPVVHAALIGSYRLTLRRVIVDLRSAGLSDADIKQIFWAEMKPSWDEATQ